MGCSWQDMTKLYEAVMGEFVVVDEMQQNTVRQEGEKSVEGETCKQQLWVCVVFEGICNSNKIDIYCKLILMLLISEATENKHEITNLLDSEIKQFSIAVASCGSNYPFNVQRNSSNICCSIFKTQSSMSGSLFQLVSTSKLIFVAAKRVENKDDSLKSLSHVSDLIMLLCKVIRALNIIV